MVLQCTAGFVARVEVEAPFPLIRVPGTCVMGFLEQLVLLENVYWSGVSAAAPSSRLVMPQPGGEVKALTRSFHYSKGIKAETVFLQFFSC
jgi:hypothetical protein